MSFYVTTGSYKSLHCSIVKRNLVPKRADIVKVFLTNHKSILISKKYLRRRRPVVPIDVKVKPVVSEEKSCLKNPNPSNCCCPKLCSGECSDNRCCCPSFIRCKVHNIYKKKNLKTKMTTRKVQKLPVSLLPRGNKTRPPRYSKPVLIEKPVEIKEEYDEYVDEVDTRFEDYEKMTVELVSPTILTKSYRKYRKKRGSKKRDIDYKGQTIDPESEFPITPIAPVRRKEPTPDYIRNLQRYERIITNRK